MKPWRQICLRMMFLLLCPVASTCEHGTFTKHKSPEQQSWTRLTFRIKLYKKHTLCEPPHSWRMWCAFSVHCLKFPNWGFPSRASESIFISHFLLQITTKIDSTHWISLHANINLPWAKGHWNLLFCLGGTHSAGEITFFIFIHWNKSVWRD